jgi:membrane-bound serine protease (ClpP class)
MLSPYALQVLPVDWAGAALILLAFAFFVVDLKVANHGLPTAGAIVALVLGGLLLSGAVVPYPWVSLVTLVVVAIFVGGTLFVVASEARAARGRPVSTGMEGMIGEAGVVRKPVSGGSPGWVFVHGERWQAVAAGVPEDAYGQDHERAIGVGRRVRVVGCGDGKVVVVPLEAGASGHPPEET